jgi:hypothetical protein
LSSDEKQLITISMWAVMSLFRLILWIDLHEVYTSELKRSTFSI